MTLVGKILIVAILIMSVVFMGFAMAVYTTQTNWKAVVNRPQSEVTASQPLGLTFQLENKETEIEELKEELRKVAQQLSEVRASEEAQRAKLDAKLTTAVEQRDRAVTELAQLQKDKLEWDAKWAAAQENLRTLTGQVESLQEDILAAQQERDNYFQQIVQLTDDLHERHGELTRNSELAANLAKRLSVWRQRLLDAGVQDPDVPVVGEPPALKGQILAVKNNSLIELSLGSDDGLREGHVVHVYRAGRAYLGRATIVRTATDRAVAKMISGTVQGNIQKGDRVATSLKLG